VIHNNQKFKIYCKAVAIELECRFESAIVIKQLLNAIHGRVTLLFLLIKSVRTILLYYNTRIVFNF